MKKVLLATTALLATAGIAAAQSQVIGSPSRAGTIEIRGNAEMGVFGGDNTETQFFTDIDVTFVLSGETDSGISFGAAIDLDESWQGGGAGDEVTIDETISGIDINGDGDALDIVTINQNTNPAFAPDDDGGVEIFISGDFGSLHMGDTDGALDWAMQETNTALNAGSIGDEETSHAGYLGAYSDGFYDGQILRYTYTLGDFGVAFSVEMDDSGSRDPGFAIGGRYKVSFGGGSVLIGAGYQYAEVGAGNVRTGTAHGAGDTDNYGISAAVSLDAGFSGTIAYSVFDAPGVEQTHFGVGVGYTFDDITVHANYGIFDDDAGGESEGFGLAASYNLGGGLSGRLGYGGGDSDSAFSLGLNMNF